LGGIGASEGGFAYEERRRVIAQAQAGSMLDGELAIRADFTGLRLQVAAQGIGQSVGSGEGTDRRAAHARYGSTHRLPSEHCIEINDAVYVGEGHPKGAGHLRRNGFRKPTVELLCSVQGRQQRNAALRRKLGEDRAQANQISFGHRV
jgi:hypothetical protein